MTSLNTKRIACARCGVEQDPEHPVCAHMLGQKGGRAAAKTLLAKYGFEHYARLGRSGAKTRWGYERKQPKRTK